MKRLILLMLIKMFSLYTNAQQSDYTFKINSVTNIGGSKDQEVDENYREIVIEYYSNGDILKTIYE